MGNLALHSAEEPDNLRATTGTVEVPTKRDNDVALAPGARPIQQHENAARHISLIIKFSECQVANIPSSSLITSLVIHLSTNRKLIHCLLLLIISSVGS